MQLRLLATVALSVGRLVAETRAGDVFVVGPGQPYSQIQAAVIAAGYGDIVLVQSGTYQGFAIAGKGVSVVADAGATVVIEGGILVTNVPGGGTVLLDRLTNLSAYTNSVTPHGLQVKNCAGAVRVQQCGLVGADGDGVLDLDSCSTDGEPDASDGAYVEDSEDVSFSSCTLLGGSGSMIWDVPCHLHGYILTGGKGGNGLSVADSAVTVYDSQVAGGGSGSGGYSSSAGHGIWVDGGASSLVLSRVAATGGSGGDSYDGFAPLPGGPGGNGLHNPWAAEIFYLESVFTPGVQGAGYVVPGGTPALPIAGSATAWSGSAKSIGFLKLLREGQATPLGVGGEPGESVLVFASVLTQGLLSEKAKGTFTPGLNALLGPFALGVVPAAGQVNVNVVMPDLPPGVEGVGLYLQAVLVGPSTVTLSSWGHLTLLDASF